VWPSGPNVELCSKRLAIKEVGLALLVFALYCLLSARRNVVTPRFARLSSLRYASLILCYKYSVLVRSAH
jgi:formate hydrogenlyase subunit 4